MKKQNIRIPLLFRYHLHRYLPCRRVLPAMIKAPLPTGTALLFAYRSKRRTLPLEKVSSCKTRLRTGR